MKITFNDLDDFLRELTRDKDAIERGIVRVNTERARSEISPSVSNVFVRAECLVKGHIVLYRQYCGALWGFGNDVDDETRTKQRKLRDALDEGLRRLGITDIRGGMLEEEEVNA